MAKMSKLFFFPIKMFAANFSEENCGSGIAGVITMLCNNKMKFNLSST